MIFTNNIKIHEAINYNPTEDEIRKMPQFYRYDFEKTHVLAPPFMKEFFLRVAQYEMSSKANLFHKDNFKYQTVDSRSHMLKPEWFPCIPGWHCDDFNRDNNNIPNFELLQKKPSRCYVMVIGKSAMPEFINEPLDFPDPLSFKNNNQASCQEDCYTPIYGIYHKLIEDKKKNGLKTIFLKSNEIAQFDALSFHQGHASKYSEWRCFVRVIFSDVYSPKNEIRTQTQVYLNNPYLGW